MLPAASVWSIMFSGCLSIPKYILMNTMSPERLQGFYSALVQKFGWTQALSKIYFGNKMSKVKVAVNLQSMIMALWTQHLRKIFLQKFTLWK